MIYLVLKWCFFSWLVLSVILFLVVRLKELSKSFIYRILILSCGYLFWFYSSFLFIIHGKTSGIYDLPVFNAVYFNSFIRIQKLKPPKNLQFLSMTCFNFLVWCNNFFFKNCDVMVYNFVFHLIGTFYIKK